MLELKRKDREELVKMIELTQNSFFTENDLSVIQCSCPKCNGFMNINTENLDWACIFFCGFIGSGYRELKQKTTLKNEYSKEWDIWNSKSEYAEKVREFIRNLKYNRK